VDDLEKNPLAKGLFDDERAIQQVMDSHLLGEPV
jgi:hypothetical protein